MDYLLLELTEVRTLAVMVFLVFRDTDVLGIRFIGQGQREIGRARQGSVNSADYKSSGLLSWFFPEGCLSFLDDKHDLMQC